MFHVKYCVKLGVMYEKHNSNNASYKWILSFWYLQHEIPPTSVVLEQQIDDEQLEGS